MGNVRSGLAASLASVALLLTVVAPLAGAATPTGRIQGKLTDEAGQPIPDLEIRFVPSDNSGNAPRTLKSNKKGAFTHAFFPAGSYRIELPDTSRFIKSMTYVRKDASNVELERTQGDAHPERGLPPFPVQSGERVELTIVVTSGQARASVQQQVGVADASGPLRKINDLFVAGDMEGALAEADRVLAEKPELGTAHYLRGMTLGRLGRYEEGAAALRKALELTPQQPGVEAALGTILVQRGQQMAKNGELEQAKPLLDEAVTLLEKELAREPNSLPVLTNRAAALETAGRHDELVKALEDLIAAKPDDVVAHLRLAQLHMQAGRKDEALAAMQRLPATDKTAARDLYNMAARLFNDGSVSEAILVAKRALEIDPDLALLHRLLARAYLSQDNQEAAKAELKLFLEKAPDDPQADVEREMLKALEKTKG